MRKRKHQRQIKSYICNNKKKRKTKEITLKKKWSTTRKWTERTKRKKNNIINVRSSYSIMFGRELKEERKICLMLNVRNFLWVKFVDD